MKTYLTLAFLLFSTHSFAINPGEFCETLDWDTSKIDCLKTANKGYIDENALDICIDFTFDKEKIGCLTVLLDKTYSPSEVRVCKDQTFESDKLKCLQATGKLPTDDRTNLKQINKIGIIAKDSLNRGDSVRALKAIDQIIMLSK